MDKKYIVYSKLDENFVKNEVANVLKIIAGVIFVGGIITGIAMGVQEIETGYYYTFTEKVFVWSVALVCWVSGFISSALIWGFSEVINLLHKIQLQKYIVTLASQEEINQLTNNETEINKKER